MKVFIETLGCPKNFNDSEVASGILVDNNYIMTTNPEEADIIIVNTCGFINDAKKESIDRIFEMAELKSKGKKLIVSGCLSQRYGSELYEEMPEVDDERAEVINYGLQLVIGEIPKTFVLILHINMQLVLIQIAYLCGVLILIAYLCGVLKLHINMQFVLILIAYLCNLY